MNDIGVVKFTHDKKNNLISSVWAYKINDNTYTGTGKVEGEINSDYCGKFNVTYFNDDGKVTHEYGLEISQEGNHYNLEWIQKEKIVYTGIGMLVNNILYAGWRLI